MTQAHSPSKFLHLVVILVLLVYPLALGKGMAQGSADKTSPEQESSVATITALATQYYLGDRQPKNYSKAAELFLQAAGMGSAMAQYNVGSMYEKGIGLPSDYSKAYVFYHASALKGYRPALESLENLRRFMSAKKLAEIEKAPLPTRASAPEVSSLQMQHSMVNSQELRSWLQGIQPAAGGDGQR